MIKGLPEKYYNPKNLPQVLGLQEVSVVQNINGYHEFLIASVN